MQGLLLNFYSVIIFVVIFEDPIVVFKTVGLLMQND